MILAEFLQRLFLGGLFHHEGINKLKYTKSKVGEKRANLVLKINSNSVGLKIIKIGWLIGWLVSSKSVPCNNNSGRVHLKRNSSSLEFPHS